MKVETQKKRQFLSLKFGDVKTKNRPCHGFRRHLQKYTENLKQASREIYAQVRPPTFLGQSFAL